MLWSKPVPCDLTRTSKRVSVPQSYAEKVPALPGVCVIVRLDESAFEVRVLNIGKTGQLRERVANGASHAPAQRIADSIGDNRLPRELKAIWMVTATREEAICLENELLALFKKEFGRRPDYNLTGGNTANYVRSQAEYDALKQHIMAL